jgi:hypothetical protein
MNRRSAPFCEIVPTFGPLYDRCLWRAKMFTNFLKLQARLTFQQKQVRDNVTGHVVIGFATPQFPVFFEVAADNLKILIFSFVINFLTWPDKLVIEKLGDVGR